MVVLAIEYMNKYACFCFTETLHNKVFNDKYQNLNFTNLLKIAILFVVVYHLLAV